MKTINDLDFNRKKALIRVDFNVPLNEKLEVTDTSRIEAAKPTIIKILEDGGSCVLMSHLGRPKNREAEFSLRNIVNSVSDVLGVNVQFVEDCIGEIAENAVSSCEPGKFFYLKIYAIILKKLTAIVTLPKSFQN